MQEDGATNLEISVTRVVQLLVEGVCWQGHSIFRKRQGK